MRIHNNTQSGIFVIKPTRSSVLFNGKYISFSGIARAQNLQQPTVSRIFSGVYQPTLHYAQKISAALGMRLDEFLIALDAHVANRQEKGKRILSQYDSRLRREKVEDDARASVGLPLIARLPLSKKVS